MTFERVLIEESYKIFTLLNILSNFYLVIFNFYLNEKNLIGENFIVLFLFLLECNHFNVLFRIRLD